MNTLTYSVSELTAYIRHLLEENDLLQSVKVQGEISNVTYHRSGHVYFTVKDVASQLSCVWFKPYVSRSIRLTEGMEVSMKGDITVYPPRGAYQLKVYEVSQKGIGSLYEQFERLKNRLLEEGIFEAVHKKPIPPFPQRIAIITSPTGAAIRDVLQTCRRRFPSVEVILVPAVVQGQGGKASLIKALQAADTLSADTILLVRGGGSLEDLWNFNEEEVARAIFQCQTPVISGIGHETDITIADFVSDLRASTPTAAAELAVPSKEVLLGELSAWEKQLEKGLTYFHVMKQQQLDEVGNRLEQHMKTYLREKKYELETLAAKMEAYDLTKTLEKGFSISMVNGKVITSVDEVKPKEVLETRLAKGKLTSIISEKNT
ncbi:MAG: exodeoxyribonuclease VII large subunit [Bacteroidota bacterium]